MKDIVLYKAPIRAIKTRGAYPRKDGEPCSDKHAVPKEVPYRAVISEIIDKDTVDEYDTPPKRINFQDFEMLLRVGVI